MWKVKERKKHVQWRKLERISGGKIIYEKYNKAPERFGPSVDLSSVPVKVSTEMTLESRNREKTYAILHKGMTKTGVLAF